ncbi:hypothetical protein NM22_15655 [Vibrio tubiashii]|nr:hypothetical protein NM22_15655 [Vibrio tubiashii]
MSNKIVLGTAQFGLDYGITNDEGVVGDSQMDAIIELCISNGVQLLDTAPAYGISEERLGGNERITSGDIQVITKTQLDSERVDIRQMITNVKASLARLGVDSLYGLLIHDPNAFTGVNSTQYLQFLAELKEIGLAKKVGISIYSRAQVDRKDILEAIDFVQLPFSVFDQRMKTNGFLEKLKKHGIEIHARSVFLQGLLLANDALKLPSIEQYHRQFIEMTERMGISKVEAAIKFVDNIQEIDKIIIGSVSSEQMREIFSAISKEIDTSQWDFLAIDNPKLVDPTQW